MMGWVLSTIVPGVLVGTLVSAFVMATMQTPPQPPPREWHDVFLITLLVVFYFMKGTLIQRRSGLGWALTSANITLAALFAWGLFAPLVPNLPGIIVLGSALRVMLAIVVLLSIVELAAARFGWPSPLEMGWERWQRRFDTHSP